MYLPRVPLFREVAETAGFLPCALLALHSPGPSSRGNGPITCPWPSLRWPLLPRVGKVILWPFCRTFFSVLWIIQVWSFPLSEPLPCILKNSVLLACECPLHGGLVEKPSFPFNVSLSISLRIFKVWEMDYLDTDCNVKWDVYLLFRKFTNSLSTVLHFTQSLWKVYTCIWPDKNFGTSLIWNSVHSLIINELLIKPLFYQNDWRPFANFMQCFCVLGTQTAPVSRNTPAHTALTSPLILPHCSGLCFLLSVMFLSLTTSLLAERTDFTEELGTCAFSLSVVHIVWWSSSHQPRPTVFFPSAGVKLEKFVLLLFTFL